MAKIIGGKRIKSQGQSQGALLFMKMHLFIMRHEFIKIDENTFSAEKMNPLYAILRPLISANTIDIKKKNARKQGFFFLIFTPLPQKKDQDEGVGFKGQRGGHKKPPCCQYI